MSKTRLTGSTAGRLGEVPEYRPPCRNRLILPQGHGLLEYSIESMLGQGGFGTTYLCRDGHLQKQVVIKSPDGIAKFERTPRKGHAGPASRRSQRRYADVPLGPFNRSRGWTLGLRLDFVWVNIVDPAIRD